jgi:hypothetical protein
MYMLQKNHTEETKEQFYDNLQHLLYKTPKSDIIIILGDAKSSIMKREII